MTTKELIRAEIERRKNKWLAASRLVKKGKDTAMYAAGKSSAYTELLSFLDTLPDEPVTDCHDLTGKKTFDDYLKASPSERRKMNMAEILGEERLAKTKRTMKLEEGIYEIPDDCTAVYSKRKVIVKKMLDADKPKFFHCADCIHQKWGRLTMRNQWYDSPYCEKRPKFIEGKGGYFYNAYSSKKACEMFEKKGS